MYRAGQIVRMEWDNNTAIEGVLTNREADEWWSAGHWITWGKFPTDQFMSRMAFEPHMMQAQVTILFDPPFVRPPEPEGFWAIISIDGELWRKDNGMWVSEDDQMSAWENLPNVEFAVVYEGT